MKIITRNGRPVARAEDNIAPLLLLIMDALRPGKYALLPGDGAGGADPEAAARAHAQGAADRARAQADKPGHPAHGAGERKNMNCPRCGGSGAARDDADSACRDCGGRGTLRARGPIRHLRILSGGTACGSPGKIMSIADLEARVCAKCRAVSRAVARAAAVVAEVEAVAAE